MKKVLWILILLALSVVVISCDDIGDYGAIGLRSKSNDLTRKWTYNGGQSIEAEGSLIVSAQGSRRKNAFDFSLYPAYERHGALIKINSDAAVEWHKVYSDLTINQIHRTADGSIYAFCAKSQDLIIIKHNDDGSIVWTKKMSMGLWESSPLNIIASDNDFILSGSRISGSVIPFLIKMDLEGNVIWSKNYRGLDSGHITSIKSEDDGYIASTSDSEIIKFNKQGEIIWARAFDVPEGSDEYISTVETTIHPFEGGYLFSGERNNDLWLAAVTKEGQLIWEYKYDSEYGIDVEEMLATSDGNIALIANTISFKQDNESNTNRIWMSTINPAEGNLIWQKVYDIWGNDSVNSAIVRDNGFLFTGTINDLATVNRSVDALLVSVDFNGGFPDYDGDYSFRTTSVAPTAIESSLTAIEANITVNDFTIDYEDSSIEQNSATTVITSY